MKPTISVKVNAAGAVKNERFAFTDRYTLVTELLQNARRAGATAVAISYDEKSGVLTVLDDGSGIADFQKLLTYHETGWDTVTKEQELPFGVGFTKCLYEATRVVVTSGSKMVDIDTAKALQMEPIEVQDVPAGLGVNGTSVTLHGVFLANLHVEMQRRCRGFSLPVHFNDQPLGRDHSQSRLPGQQTSVGFISLKGLDTGDAQLGATVYLQGFQVLRLAGGGEWGNVVHLDSKQFIARRPDRNVLIDEDVQAPKIFAAMRAIWRETLIQAKGRLDAAEFVRVYYQALRAWGCMDLLNDVDLLPRALLSTLKCYPCLGDRVFEQYTDTADPLDVTRSAVESGQVTLVELGDVWEGNILHWMLAREKGWLAVNGRQLDAGHWVQEHILTIEDEDAEVFAEGAHGQGHVQGSWVSAKCTLCKSVRIKIGDHEVVITDDGVADGEDLLIPDGEHSGLSVRQLCTFVDEFDVHRDDVAEEDERALRIELRNRRVADPQEAMQALLGHVPFSTCPAVHGRRYIVHVSSDGLDGCKVELLPDVVPTPPEGSTTAGESSSAG